MGIRGSFRGLQNGWGVKLITNLHLAPMSKMVELYLHCPTRLHCVVVSY
jgi:hypothetical protein